MPYGPYALCIVTITYGLINVKKKIIIKVIKVVYEKLYEKLVFVWKTYKYAIK